jgi:hypothetical protein
MNYLHPIKIISLYAELTSGIKVSEFLSKYTEDGVDKVNIKYFIEFGLLKKLIYRVNRHIVISQTSKRVRNKSPQRDKFFFFDQSNQLTNN